MYIFWRKYSVCFFFISTIVNATFKCLKIFVVEVREPGLVLEKGDFQILHDNHLQFPNIYILDANHYLRLVSRVVEVIKKKLKLTL